MSSLENLREIARVIKRELHRDCCSGAALDDVCETLSDKDLRVARAVLAALTKGRGSP